MSKIVQINATCGAGSTGKICVAVSKLLSEQNIENYIYYSTGNSSYPLGRKYMSDKEIKLQALLSRVFGNYGFQARRATKRLIKELEKISPDIIHLHNIHSHNIHFGLLFDYFRTRKIKIYWTFHDCWAFTGYCPHYDMLGCEKWKNEGCHNCPQKNRFSWFVDRSKYIFEKKKKTLQGLDLTIITPSQWLANQVKQSFLKQYDVKVINNGIDLEVFKPTESDFRQRYNLENKFIVLGVAFGWGERKGLDVFVELSKRLDSNKFQMVLVGTDSKIDDKLPRNIISIHRTNNQRELAEIYTAADVFVNPTREENFPTTHLESLACGTPVIAFNTGGCSEMLNSSCGCVVEKNNIDSLCKKIIDVCTKKTYVREICIQTSKSFCAHEKFKMYLNNM